MNKQTHSFQAETKELLDLMIHSLYSHREVFLRELISNASDAIEKLKFEMLTHPSLNEKGAQEFEIFLDPHPESKTLVIRDNGIGMTEDEVIKNIGTIAHSGTKSFLKMRQEIQSHPELIGQFGVGFYSAFMVADRVTLHTQKAGTTEGVLWESDASGTYTIEKVARPEGTGTTITLHLKEFKKEEEGETLHDFTNEWTLRSLVKKYSDFIPYPIKMKGKSTEGTEGAEGKEEIQTLNTQKAIWLKSPSEIKEEEYKEFYHHVSHDWKDPLKTIHYKAEGTIEFVSILFIPEQKPFNYEYKDHAVGLNLYAKRVFIMGDCKDLIPPYLRFVKGVVDSDDISLNVSRELLQQDRQVLRIKKSLVGKVLSSLKEMLEKERSKYEIFWGNFGNTLKEGIPTEASQADKLKELLLFYSSETNQWTTLGEYVARMKPDQKAIYYVTGDSISVLKNSPYLEKLKAKGLEVLLMTDRVDPWLMTYLTEFDGKSLQSITAENLDLNTEEEKKTQEEEKKKWEEKLKPLITVMEETLKEKVKEVRLSERLTESPVCLVSSQNEMSAHLERLMESVGQAIPKSKRILEINASHPLYERMLHLSKQDQEDWSDILFQQALLNEGSMIADPLQYSKKIADLMVKASLHK